MRQTLLIFVVNLSKRLKATIGNFTFFITELKLKLVGCVESSRAYDDSIKRKKNIDHFVNIQMLLVCFTFNQNEFYSKLLSDCIFETKSFEE